jgi:hypothetical protein
MTDEYIFGRTIHTHSVRDKDWAFIRLMPANKMAETLAPNEYIRLLKQKCPPDLDAELATIISDKSKSITDKFDDFVDLMREHGSAGPLPKLSDVSTTSP